METAMHDPSDESLIGPLEVVDLRVDGGAVARHQGKVVFLEDAVPGDVVMARVIRDKKKIIQAEVTELLSPSQHRTTPWCPYFSLCGGCSWQHIRLDYQREWKKKHVEETLKRIGGIDIPVASVISSPKARHFRTKVSYAFGTEGGELQLGLKQKKSTEIVPISECGLQSPQAGRILDIFLQAARHRGLSAWEQGNGYLRYLVVHTPEYETADQDGGIVKQALVEVITGPEQKGEHAALAEILQTMYEIPGLVTGLAHGERWARSDVPQAEKAVRSFGLVDLFESYGGQPLLFPYNGFMQTNTGAAALLYNKVRELADLSSTPNNPVQVLDVYCGVGSIGLHLANERTVLTGIDSQTQAISYAEKNAQKRPEVRSAFVGGQAARALRRLGAVPDIIVIDPPRAGMEQAVVAQLALIEAGKLLYVSCDVATQARDIKELLQAGWKAVSAHPVDMFPYTPHVENIVVLDKKE